MLKNSLFYLSVLFLGAEILQHFCIVFGVLCIWFLIGYRQVL